ncbi:hypothetical protein AVEN_173882-1 [Araneus ventricosus]|uniref:Uncharacterized protein n=1 Tax=Araneus ventricosus TaxID=182803 RepID=A0A4Y2V998_ARAVE|nr:hypothetical protein AVEN_173882-1 [Araneus ventricosus]
MNRTERRLLPPYPCSVRSLNCLMGKTRKFYLRQKTIQKEEKNIDSHYGEKGDPMHYATKCRFTLSWHLQTPTVSLKLQWLKNILTDNFSRTRLRLLMRFICDENNLIVVDNN